VWFHKGKKVPKSQSLGVDPDHWHQGYVSTDRRMFGVQQSGILCGKVGLGQKSPEARSPE
jgi:hypothetical protein